MTHVPLQYMGSCVTSKVFHPSLKTLEEPAAFCLALPSANRPALEINTTAQDQVVSQQRTPVCKRYTT